MSPLRRSYPPSFRPQRAVPPGGGLHDSGRGLGGGPARRPVRRCGTRLRSRVLRTKGLRTPGLAQAPGRARGAAGGSWEIVIDIVLVLPVAIVWLTFVPARGLGRHSPPR